MDDGRAEGVDGWVPWVRVGGDPESNKQREHERFLSVRLMVYSMKRAMKPRIKAMEP